MTISPLIRICFRSSKAHPLRTLLLIFGIALGVAGVIAIDIAKTSVNKSFELSTAALTSQSTHQVTGPDFTVPQSLFTHIRTKLGIAASAPVITREVKVKEITDRKLTLMGIDPFSEAGFRDLRFEDNNKQSKEEETSDLRGIMTQGAGVIMSSELAREYNLIVGQPLSLVFEEREVQVKLGAIMADLGTSGPFEGVLLADIALAQELLGLGDRITRIDLKLEQPKDIEAVRNVLPKGLVLVETAKQTSAVRGLSRAFETSLSAFSILVLFMGIFLIYNTVSFSVTRRRQINGTLRALGATPKEIFWAQEIEVMAYAVAGSVLGVGLGILMGKGAVHAVCATVSDMYYTLTVSRTSIEPLTLIKGAGIGLTAAFVSSLAPAINAARTEPVTLMQVSSAASRLDRHLWWLALAGTVCLGTSLVIFLQAGTGINIVFTGVFLVFIGASLLSPAALVLVIKVLGQFTAFLPTRGNHPLMAKMAMGNIRRFLSRSSVLIASLMVVISVYIGIDTMTRSFRLSIIDWVDGHIGGDVHISSLDGLNRGLDKEFIYRIGSLERVTGVSAYNIHPVFSPASGKIHVFSYLEDLSEKQWIWTIDEGADNHIKGLLEQGWIIVSEIFAKQHNVKVGPNAIVEMNTIKGPVQFKIAGIFRDFFMGGGRIVVSRKTMEIHWGHKDITSAQIFVLPEFGQDKTKAIEQAISNIKAIAPDTSVLRIRTGPDIKSSILAVFDKTFLITSALQILTALVALTGIINSVMALVLERSRELGILRACGAVPAQIRTLVLWECGMSGLLAGLLALPLGAFLSWILVAVVNYRSFGWTYEMNLSVLTLVQALGFAALAALGSGFYPAVRAGRVNVSLALKTE